MSWIHPRIPSAGWAPWGPRRPERGRAGDSPRRQKGTRIPRGAGGVRRAAPARRMPRPPPSRARPWPAPPGAASPRPGRPARHGPPASPARSALAGGPRPSGAEGRRRNAQGARAARRGAGARLGPEGRSAMRIKAKAMGLRPLWQGPAAGMPRGAAAPSPAWAHTEAAPGRALAAGPPDRRALPAKGWHAPRRARHRRPRPVRGPGRPRMGCHGGFEGGPGKAKVEVRYPRRRPARHAARGRAVALAAAALAAAARAGVPPPDAVAGPALAPACVHGLGGFGRAAALSDDGSALAVGSPHDSGAAAGALAVGADGDGSAATGVLHPGDAGFAEALDRGGARGSGAAYVYRRSASGRWALGAFVKVPISRENDSFGESVALSADGGTLAAGDRARRRGPGHALGGRQRPVDPPRSRPVQWRPAVGHDWRAWNPLHDWARERDDAGSVRRREDRVNGLRESFSCDGLDRLVRASASTDAPSPPARRRACTMPTATRSPVPGGFCAGPAATDSPRRPAGAAPRFAHVPSGGGRRVRRALAGRRLAGRRLAGRAPQPTPAARRRGEGQPSAPAVAGVWAAKRRRPAWRGTTAKASGTARGRRSTRTGRCGRGASTATTARRASESGSSRTAGSRSGEATGAAHGPWERFRGTGAARFQRKAGTWTTRKGRCDDDYREGHVGALGAAESRGDAAGTATRTASGKRCGGPARPRGGSAIRNGRLHGPQERAPSPRHPPAPLADALPGRPRGRPASAERGFREEPASG